MSPRSASLAESVRSGSKHGVVLLDEEMNAVLEVFNKVEDNLRLSLSVTVRAPGEIAQYATQPLGRSLHRRAEPCDPSILRHIFGGVRVTHERARQADVRAGLCP